MKTIQGMKMKKRYNYNINFLIFHNLNLSLGGFTSVINGMDRPTSLRAHKWEMMLVQDLSRNPHSNEEISAKMTL